MSFYPLHRRAGGRTDSWAPVFLPFAIIVAIIVFTIAFFVSATVWSRYEGSFSCLPNGTPVYYRNTSYIGGIVYYGDVGNNAYRRNTLWESQQFLSIPLGFGSFTFAGAKGTDVAWDLIVGRGGQVLLTAISYPIFRRSMLHMMQVRGTSLPVFVAFAFGM